MYSMKTHLKFPLLFLLLFPCVSSYAQRYKTPIFTASDIVIGDYTYSVYNEDSHVRIYSPNNAIDPVRNRPLLVIIHGGAFTPGNGTLDDWDAQAPWFASMGYIVATVNYRLLATATSNPSFSKYIKDNQGVVNKTSSWPWYAAVQDVTAAIKYLCYYKAVLGFDPNQIYLLGESAGGVTAQTLALASQSDIDYVFSFSSDPAVGGLNASTLAPCKSQTFTIKGVATLSGGLPYASFLSGNENVPLFMQHSTHDTVVPIGGIFQFFNSTGDNGTITKLKSVNASGLTYPCSYLYANYDANGELSDPATYWHLLTLSGKNLFCNSYIVPFFYDIISNTTNCKQDYSFTYVNVYSDAPPVSLRISSDEIAMQDNSNNTQQLSAYPNPVQDQVILQGLSTVSSTTLIVRDSQGNAVRTMALQPENDGQQKINLDGLPAGIYLIQVKDEQSSKVLKIVKN